jgi:hypothetical protein
MGAGPTKAQVAAGRRKSLQHIASTYGGHYHKPTRDNADSVTGDGWAVFARLIRASNGEAALLFWGVGANGQTKEYVSSADVMRELGVSPVNLEG